jgi:type IV pilus assembly protein PilM
MPLMTEDELRSAIRFQANDYIPIPIDEAIIDFQIISERESDRQDKMMDVLVVAARKDMVESTIAAVEGAGLRPIIVDVSSLAFARAVLTDVEESFLKEEAGDAGATTLINISSSLTDIVVLEDNIPRFTRISSMGGDAFTDALVNQLGIPFNEAEELKTKIGLRSDGDESSLPEIDPSISMYKETVNNVLEQEMDRFIAEIRRSLDYYLVQSARAKRIEKIIVTGGGAKLRNILRYMKERLQVEVEPGHPLHSVQVARKLSEAGVDSDELSMAICLGLAMRGVEG